MFTESDIRKQTDRGITYIKGYKLYTNGSVLGLDEEYSEEDRSCFVAGSVEGSYGNEYDVSIALDDNEEIKSYSCTCSAFETYPGMCKHCVALALEYLYSREDPEREEEFEDNPLGFRKNRTDTEILDVVAAFSLRRRMKEQTACGKIEIIPELQEISRYYYYGNRGNFKLTFKIGPEDGKQYVLKNVSDFLGHIYREEMHSYGKQLAFVHSKNAFTETAWKYIELMEQARRESSARYEELGREIILTPKLWDAFFEINQGSSMEYIAITGHKRELHFLKQEPPVRFRLIAEEEKGFQIKIPPLQLIRGGDRPYVKLQQSIYQCSDDFYAGAGEFLKLADEKKETSYHIARKDMPAFCGAVLPELDELGIADRGKLDLGEFQPKKAEISFYLDEENGRVTLKTMGIYGDAAYNLLKPTDFSGEYRDRTKEIRVQNLIRSYFSLEDIGEGILYFESDDHDRMYHLLNSGISQFEAEGTVYATDRIKGRKLLKNPRTQVGVAIKSGLLELSVQSSEFLPEELAGILDSYRKKEKYHLLKSGSYIGLEENSVATVAELLDGLGVSGKDFDEGRLEIPRFRACYVDQMLSQKEGQLQAERSSDYKAVIRNMKNVEDSDYQTPETLRDVLREYQKFGFRWLNTLADLGFGGILADDMGLGKTLQTIAYLLYRKRQRKTECPHLIICPASLVYNWEREIERFAPELKTAVIAGNAQQREEMIKGDQKADIWITSYDMVKRDISLYKERQFDTEVIDEAQNIKNHGTLAAKAVKKIRAEVRFALTGTPIENRLSELWSIFDFLMPGILGTYEKFRKGYELPIVQNQDERLAKRLKRMISPFILRRVKSEVLKELPDKLEQVVYARMGEEQRKIYESHALRLMESLEKQSEEDLQKGKLQILAELTRLRQICCAPEMLYENYGEISCKVETCMELIHQAMSGNHKVLLFSQFTSVFPILEKRLMQEKIPYYELTGQTSKEKRMQLTEQFNSGDVPIFLISLKAGGTGLNLTAASIVIHFDPWWNLAAQNQSTDRAHRIGQEQQVTVFKLIAQNTIEEKIVKLQQEKEKLASQILDGEGMAVSALTKNDFMEILEF